MKKALILAGFAFLFVTLTPPAQAATIKYDCSIVKRPSQPDWVWYRYPSKKHPNRDAYNNGRIHLIWEDSYRAHRVQIRLYLNGKKVRSYETADDASDKITGLKNGVVYQAWVRGVSNCGKGKWQKGWVKP